MRTGQRLIPRLPARGLRVGFWLCMAFLASLVPAALWPVREPTWLLHYLTPRDLWRARVYSRALTLAFAFSGALRLGALAWLSGLSLNRPAAAVVAAPRRAGLPIAWRRVGAWAAAGLILPMLLALPGDYLVGYRLARHVGLSTASFGQWLGDWGKSAAISALGIWFAVLLSYALMRRAPRRWWLPAGAIFAASVVALTFLGPVVIDPIFNRFAPLASGPLRLGIEALAARAGARVTQIFVADASRRTTALNAYVTGLGGTARIVLYDTLLAHLSQREVLLVVAHELGHWRLGHLAAGTTIGAAAVFLATVILAGLARALHRSGVLTVPDDSRGVPSLLLGVALLSLLSVPLGNAVSRRIEAQADFFAVMLTADRTGYARLQARLAAVDLVEADPPLWIEWTLSGYPSPASRIAAALQGRRVMAPVPQKEHPTFRTVSWNRGSQVESPPSR